MRSQDKFTRDQEVEVWWDGLWQAGRINKCWVDGADVVVGSLGCWYFGWEAIREPTDLAETVSEALSYAAEDLAERAEFERKHGGDEEQAFREAADRYSAAAQELAASAMLVIRVSTVEDFTIASITGPAKVDAEAAQLVIAVDDNGRAKLLKNHSLAAIDDVKVVG